MRKYRYSFPKSAFFVFALIVLASVTAIVFASLRLAGVGKYLSVYPALDVTTIVVFVIFTALIGCSLWTSYYAFTDEAFVAAQLFSRKKVSREALRKFVLDEASGVAALYFEDAAKPGALLYITINLRKAAMDSFIEDLRAFRSDIAVEVISPDKDKE